jgi:hypothetical protein
MKDDIYPFDRAQASRYTFFPMQRYSSLVAPWSEQSSTQEYFGLTIPVLAKSLLFRV